jgi:hypothetical protein
MQHAEKPATASGNLHTQCSRSQQEQEAATCGGYLLE